MKSEKIEKIITIIHEKTISGEIEWTELDSHSFELNFPNSSVIITQEEFSMEPFLHFLNQKGVPILKIGLSNLADFSENITYQMLSEIFEAAKAAALKTDETFDDVLKSLTTESTSTTSTSTSTTTTTEAPSKPPTPKIPKRPNFIE